MRRRKIPFGKDGLPAHFTHRKLGFVGIGKILEDQSAERALLIMLFHNWVFRKIFEYDYDDFDDSRVPLFDSMTPQHQVHILATIARGLLLPDTPLPPDDHVHWAGFLALYDQLDSCSETELDNARDELKSKELDREEAVTGFNRHKATHDTIRSLSNAEEKLAEDEIKHDAFLCRGAQTLRDAQQSLRRQKLMAAIVQDEVGADLNEIMKQQLSNQPEPARTTKAGILVGDTCRDPIDTSIPTDDLHRFSWRRALIHFALERGDKHFDDGRMFNLYVIACADRLPRETTEDDDAWGNLIANVRQDVIVLAPEDEKFLWGCLSEEVWARTALTLRTARQAHRAFARSWTSKQGRASSHCRRFCRPCHPHSPHLLDLSSPRNSISAYSPQSLAHSLTSILTVLSLVPHHHPLPSSLTPPPNHRRSARLGHPHGPHRRSPVRTQQSGIE